MILKLALFVILHFSTRHTSEENLNQQLLLSTTPTSQNENGSQELSIIGAMNTNTSGEVQIIMNSKRNEILEHSLFSIYVFQFLKPNELRHIRMVSKKILKTIHSEQFMKVLYSNYFKINLRHIRMVRLVPKTVLKIITSEKYVPKTVLKIITSEKFMKVQTKEKKRKLFFLDPVETDHTYYTLLRLKQNLIWKKIYGYLQLREVHFLQKTCKCFIQRPNLIQPNELGMVSFMIQLDIAKGETTFEVSVSWMDMKYFSMESIDNLYMYNPMNLF